MCIYNNKDRKISFLEVDQFELKSSNFLEYIHINIIAKFKILGSKSSKIEGKSGRWSTEEHIRFLQGLKQHGKDWKLVQLHVNQDTEPNVKREGSTRSGPQVRSHAQKFFKRIQPNLLPNESSIQCLIRTGFSIEILISGIEDNEEKMSLILELKDSLEDIPD